MNAFQETGLLVMASIVIPFGFMFALLAVQMIVAILRGE